MSSFRSQQGKTVIRMDILPPDPSGRVARAFRRGGEVVDAQFVTMNASARRTARPRSHNDNRRENTAGGTFTERAVAAAEGALSRLSADFFSAVVAVLFVAVFSLAGGFSFLFSGTDTVSAGPVLDITHVTMTQQDANGMKILLINGIVENRTGASLAMPSIRADLMSGKDVVASTLISPPSFAIAGGHSRGFSARVPHPGGKLPDLRLSLAERGA
ncbi:hypothetical protein KX729_20460 [Rhizobium sp. XQZ8]|uniref:hypothetical protein n=1 Tax=Rhizobium populisoli TaxID=2859785 RepID=UPI001CA5DD81|nr:hypothetical protein [Rhizobium populisoli]MBW6423837.1 hypothetical protein [Rhizobium populisoli]